LFFPFFAFGAQSCLTKIGSHWQLRTAQQASAATRQPIRQTGKQANRQTVGQVWLPSHPRFPANFLAWLASTIFPLTQPGTQPHDDEIHPENWLDGNPVFSVFQRHRMLSEPSSTVFPVARPASTESRRHAVMLTSRRCNPPPPPVSRTIRQHQAWNMP
jgi:hypothetical protein